MVIYATLKDGYIENWSTINAFDSPVELEYPGEDLEELYKYSGCLKVIDNQIMALSLEDEEPTKTIGIDYQKFYELEAERNAPKPKSTLELMADALDKAKPTIEKQGFHLELTYSEGMLVWEFVADEQPGGNDGTDYLRPITYIPGMSVTAGLWYTDGEDIWECIQTGENSEWTPQWFDIIAV